MLNISILQSALFLAKKSEDYIDIYKKYDEYFSNFSVITSILRDLGWLILKGLLKLTSMMNTLLDKIFDFINFLDSDIVIQFFNTVKPFIWTVFLFALLYMAYCYIYAHEKPKGVVTNILIFVGTFTVLPYMMSQMNQIVTYGKQVFSSNMEENNYELLVPYITDLVYLDSLDFNDKKIEGKNRNGFTTESSENMRYLDINEVVDPGDYKLKNEKLFKQHIFLQIENGVPKLEVIGIKKGKFFFPGTVPYYYRYHVNFFIAALYLLALILVMAFSSVKLIHLVFELAAEKIMAPFIAAGDLTGGQKIRKALIGILNGYITILCVLFLQRLFILSTEYINTRTWSDSTAANGLIKTVMIVAGALFIIDGPNFFEQIFGVDAGLKSVGQALQSAYYGSQMLGGIKRSVAGIAGKVGGAAKGAAGKAVGAAGALSGMKDTGILGSNNEKVSQDMAKGLGSGGVNKADGLSGGGQSEFSEDSSADDSGQEIGISSDGSSQGKISGGNGKQNLDGSSEAGKGKNQNEDVNGAINDALNNMPEPQQRSSTDSNIRDNNNLANWAMRNTKAGRFLADNYEKGKLFGHAAGNTINNRKRESKKSQTPEPSSQMDKDNLKK